MQSTADFLLEIGTEEMPSSPLIHATKQFGELIKSFLKEYGLSFADLRVISSPRRLAAQLTAVDVKTRAVHEIKRGPTTAIAYDEKGNPTKAAEGFARKMGIAVDELVCRQDDDGKEYVFAEKSIPARDALPLLSELSEKVIASLEWPNYRSQRWGAEHVSFVRPIRWICALFGTSCVPVRYGDVQSANITRGHRVLAPQPLVVNSPAEYEEVLERGFVLCAERRRERIEKAFTQIELSRKGAHVEAPKRFLDEVVNLCEWPTVLVGKFDEAFLSVPHEIICDSMLSNQRYFPIYDASGKLTREFVIVANGDPRYAQTFINGNERVVRARLDDAKFFFEEDLKVPLDSFVDRLKDVVFQEKLGTLYQKACRMKRLALSLAGAATSDESLISSAVRAAYLAKADLVSQTVIEFTAQQGVMGGYFAQAQGESKEVYSAIAEHYHPRFAGDELPPSFSGKIVALADKLDTVCGLFAIGEPPSGSADPFAVRRAALGIIALLQELPLIGLSPAIDSALEALKEQGIAFDLVSTKAEVVNFFAARLATIAKQEGISSDTVLAVSACGIIDPKEFLARSHALEDERRENKELFADLAAAYLRAAHLADPSLGKDIDDALLSTPEKNLFDACISAQNEVQTALDQKDYKHACHALAGLKEPIDRFFDDVLVMDSDTGVRQMRLRLLNLFVSVFSQVADIGACAHKK